MEIPEKKQVEILKKLQNGAYEAYINYSCGLESNETLLKLYLKDKKKNGSKILTANQMIEARKAQMEELDLFDKVIKEKLFKLEGK